MEEELKNKYKELANLLFPDVTGTIEELEEKYPKRNLAEGACVTRFAPSPTGFLHTGALFTSLINKRLADETNGVFFLRIEDTDKKREVEGSIKLLTNEMAEYNIAPEEGVIAEDKEVGNYSPYVQSKRRDIYRICAKYLVEKGLAYPCFCTSEMLEAAHNYQEQNKILPGYYGVYAKCRSISIDDAIKRVESGEKFIIRFKSMGSHLKKISYKDGIKGKIDIAQNDQDIVIIKSDGIPTYHFAHVIDDHFMRTTHVVRGEEWISSVPVHLELFRAMEFDAPTYVHVPNVMIMDGTSKRKLSKRKDKEAAVSFFLEVGYPVESVLEYLLTLINSDFENWRRANKMAPLEEFEVKLNKINSSGALFDMVKLQDVSKEVISRMDSSEVLKRIIEWSSKYNKEIYDLVNRDLEYSQKIFALERDNAKKIRKDLIKWEDIVELFFYFFDDLFETDIKQNGYSFDYINSNETKLNKDIVNNVLQEYINTYNENDDKDTWFANMKETASKLGFCVDMKEYKTNQDSYIGSIADFSGIIRVAMANRKNTPDIYEIMRVLGKDKVIQRLENAKK